MIKPVITYTPNPAIDVWAQCERVILTEKTRIEKVRTDPGGGGTTPRGRPRRPDGNGQIDLARKHGHSRH